MTRRIVLQIGTLAISFLILLVGAATPTAAAIMTQQAAAFSATQTQYAMDVSATNSAATLTQQARIAEVSGTSTAIAMDGLATQRAATSTAYAPTAQFFATATQQSVEHAERQRTQLRDDVLAWGITLLALAAAVLTLVFAAYGARRFVRRPHTVRRDPGEPMPLFIAGPGQALTVHDPARQPTATATTEEPGIPPGIPPLLQAEVTRLAQQGEIARAFALSHARARSARVMAAQNQMNGRPTPPGSLPTGVSADMLQRLLTDSAPAYLPRVIVLRIFDKERLISEGVTPRQADVIEGDWEHVD